MNKKKRIRKRNICLLIFVACIVIYYFSLIVINWSSLCHSEQIFYVIYGIVIGCVLQYIIKEVKKGNK